MEPKRTLSKREKKPVPVIQRPQLLQHLIKYFKYAGILFLIWNVGYWRFSPSWILLALFFYMLNEEYRKSKESKLDFARTAMKDEKEAILAKIDELPSWVSDTVCKVIKSPTQKPAAARAQGRCCVYSESLTYLANYLSRSKHLQICRSNFVIHKFCKIKA